VDRTETKIKRRFQKNKTGKLNFQLLSDFKICKYGRSLSKLTITLKAKNDLKNLCNQSVKLYIYINIKKVPVNIISFYKDFSIVV